MKSNLVRDDRWQLFYGDISLEDFAATKLPKIKFCEEVPKDVKESFRTVDNLLVHSYFEYLFVDVAVARALLIFEMALILRYKELSGGVEWDLNKKPLKSLLAWFHARHFFERSDYQFIEAIRQMRNHLIHPKRHNFGGSVFFPWIHTIGDLINGLYENVELRKSRWAATKKFQAGLIYFLKEGAKVKFLDKTFLIYGLGPLKVENRIEPVKCFFTLLPIFDLKSSVSKAPIVFGYPHDQLNLEGSKIDFTWGSGKFVLTNVLDAEEKAIVEALKNNIVADPEYLMQNTVLLHDAGKLLHQEIKKALG